MDSTELFKLSKLKVQLNLNPGPKPRNLENIQAKHTITQFYSAHRNERKKIRTKERDMYLTYHSLQQIGSPWRNNVFKQIN